MMPLPVKIILCLLFLTLFIGSLTLSRINLKKSGFFVFLKMDWVDRSEDELWFSQQTYVAPIVSGILCLFGIFQIVGD
jgi:hypothetical protein